MMSRLIDEALIRVDLEATSKEEIINQLAELLDVEKRLIDKPGYIKKVMEREEAFPTAIGFRVAIPHGKCNTVKTPSVVFARLRTPIRWSEEEEVEIVFLLAVPEEEASNRHLEILAQLSRKLMHEDFREKLLQLNTKEEIINLLDL